MSLEPNDPIVPKPIAFVQIHTEEQIRRAAEKGTRQHKLIPSAAVETLRQWDEYRAQQREMFSKMTKREQRAYLLEETMGLPSNDADFKALIATLPDLNARDAAEEQAREAIEEAKRLKAIEDSKWYNRLRRKVEEFFSFLT